MSDEKSKPGPSRLTPHSYSPNIIEPHQQNRNSGNARATGNSGARPKLSTRRLIRGPDVSMDTAEGSVYNLQQDLAFEAVEKMSDPNSKPGPSSSTGLSYSPNITVPPQENRNSSDARATGNSGALPRPSTARPIHGPHRDIDAALEAMENGELEDVEQIEDMLQDLDLARQAFDKDTEEHELERKYLVRENQALHKAISYERTKQDKLREGNRNNTPRGHPQSPGGPRLRSWDGDDVRKNVFTSPDHPETEEDVLFPDLSSLLHSLEEGSPGAPQSDSDSHFTVVEGPSGSYAAEPTSSFRQTQSNWLGVNLSNEDSPEIFNRDEAPTAEMETGFELQGSLDDVD
ncbi:hypothetical protein HPB50_004777 [Hyalomma asiaticum]|uniref:Uncharacterized protein n=1 Tax=Hyalomma asiaticum TaxID=266040 RepID=A0ACB7TF58_HYAAI|nr:hypothetical protein HPB50_004777 [Hyalomma asiaticum]